MSATNEVVPFWKSWFSRKREDKRPARPFRIAFTFYSPDGNALSMPIACLSAYLKKHLPAIDARLIDINITLPNRDDHSVAGFVDRVKAFDPDLIAISCMSPHWIPMDEYLRGLKAALPKLPVLLGGYQGILAPDESIGHPAVDYVCIGDGEEPLLALVRKLSGELPGPVPGMWEKEPSGNIVKMPPVLTEDFSELPFPDYTIYERDGSLRGLGFSIFGPKNLFILPVMTGRGCPYKCTYCCNTPLLEMYKGNGSYLRKYQPEALIEELKRLRDRYDVGYFEFWDELFLSNMKFTYHFLELYRKEIGLPFSMNSRVEKMDDKLCRTAREAGCHTVWFGIESGSERYRHNYLGRKMTNAQVLEAAENARRYGIRRLTFNIVGMPFETREDMEGTLALNQAIAPEFFFFFPYIPLRGTPLYELTKNNGLLLERPVAVDYLEHCRTGQFRTNIKEHEGGASPEDFAEVCRKMYAFQQANNRLELNDVSDELLAQAGVA